YTPHRDKRRPTLLRDQISTKHFPRGLVGVERFFTLSRDLTPALLIDEFAKQKKLEIVWFF
ncbi:hypothetical protein ACJBX7_10980, partial [Streptococcus suis]